VSAGEQGTPDGRGTPGQGEAEKAESAGQAKDRWTVMEALRWTAGHLESNEIENPRLQAERMLSAATGLSRVELYAHHDRPLSPEERAAYRALIGRRVAGEPLQYVVGEVAFRHLILKMRSGVFIPRPETEMLVQAVIDRVEAADGAAVGHAAGQEAGEDEPRPRSGEPRVLDLCTGSGAVALSLALELPGSGIVAVDASEEALDCARANAGRLGLADAVELRKADLLDAVGAGERFDVVVANPPYVPSEALEDLEPAVRDHEPAAALDGGPEGLACVERIISGALGVLEPGGLLALELDSSHAERAADLARDAGFECVTVLDDLAGRPRILVGEAPDA
jgi:release factor glutamine methyltransferase